MSGPTQGIHRRELALGTARWIALALLGGGAAFLWWRNGATDTCRLSLPCASCPKNGGCDLVRTNPEPNAPTTSKRTR